MPLAIWSLPQFIMRKKNAAFKITPKDTARIAMSFQAGFAISPNSCKTGKVSPAIAIENRGAQSPITIPIIRSILFLDFKIPLV